MLANVIACVSHFLAKDSLTRLRFTNILDNPYNDDPENKDVPEMAESDQTNKLFDSLTNTGNCDPYSITIRITGVKNDEFSSKQDDDNLVEDC